MNSIPQLLSYLLISIIFIGCQSTPTNSQTQEHQNSDVKSIAKEESNPSSEKFPGASKVLSTSYGNSIPVYQFENFEQEYLKNEDGKTHVLNFWATWCIPCIQELPYFFESEEAYQDENIDFVYVSLDFVSDLEKKLIPFMEKRKINARVVVLDQKGVNEWLEKINKNWDGAIPATLIYNNKEHIFHREKFESTEDVKAVIEAVLD